MRAHSSATLGVLVLLLAGCGGPPAAGREPLCGDGVVGPDEGCDDGGNNGRAPDACRPTCVLPACGDGIRDSTEGCDDGPDNDDLRPGACRTTCEPASCGDGVVDPGEGCDDGSANDDLLPDACRTTCVPASCGDGVVDAEEDCDDGAGNDDGAADACRTSCMLSSCGDGVVDAGESCDEGEENDDRRPDRCRTDCTSPWCGDGVRDTGEGCDAGAANSDERPGACRTSCEVARCGDGVTDPGEECDAGAANSDTGADSCRLHCLLPGCGDGVVDPLLGEVCDDGNSDPGDGCHGCGWYVGVCEVNHQATRPTIDLTAGAPWDGEELVVTGTLADAADHGPNWDCNSTATPDVLYALPIPRAGDLIVRLSSTSGDFLPSVEIRRQCSMGWLACENAPALGEAAVAVVRGVAPTDVIRWIQVESAGGPPGPFELSARVVPPLPVRSPCTTDGVSGSCEAELACHDPDGDGSGNCRELVPVGGPCDAAGVDTACLESACTCPTPGCVIGTCTSTCGDAVIQPWEECDDGDVSAADNCTPACLYAGRSCETPYRLDLSLRADGVYEWNGDSELGDAAFTASCGDTGKHPEVYASFTVPEAGTWAFQLVPASGLEFWWSALSIGTGTCGSGEELACAAASSWAGETPTIRVSLDAGETVWPIVDGTGATVNLQRGRFTLLAQRVACGDGAVGLAEECDDGNLVDGDGCSAACRVEAGSAP